MPVPTVATKKLIPKPTWKILAPYTTHALLQTSVAAPPPEVDEETLRRLDKILWGIPSEMDDATAYATLKARLGLPRSKDPAPSFFPKTETPSAPPTSHTPNPTPQNCPPSLPETTSPIQPLSSPIAQPPPLSPIHAVQNSEDASDEGGCRGDYGQPFAIPSPKSGGGGPSIHEPHLTEGSEINDEEVDDLHPLFNYGDAKKKEETVVQRPRAVR